MGSRRIARIAAGAALVVGILALSAAVEHLSFDTPYRLPATAALPAQELPTPFAGHTSLVRIISVVALLSFLMALVVKRVRGAFLRTLMVVGLIGAALATLPMPTNAPGRALDGSVEGTPEWAPDPRNVLDPSTVVRRTVPRGWLWGWAQPGLSYWDTRCSDLCARRNSAGPTP